MHPYDGLRKARDRLYPRRTDIVKAMHGELSGHSFSALEGSVEGFEHGYSSFAQALSGSPVQVPRLVAYLRLVRPPAAVYDSLLRTKGIDPEVRRQLAMLKEDISSPEEYLPGRHLLSLPQNQRELLESVIETLYNKETLSPEQREGLTALIGGVGRARRR